VAKRLTVNGRMSNLLSYTLNYNGRGADFQQVGESRGSGNQQSSIQLGTSFDLHRFFEATGIVMPVTYTYSRNSSVPRFTAGDDVERTGPLAAASETRQTAQSYGTSYARTWSQHANTLLRYTIGGITAGWNRTENDSRDPISVGSSNSVAANVNYDIAPRQML